eukprot:3164267-Pleurochrysis_carterae.AAC.9
MVVLWRSYRVYIASEYGISTKMLLARCRGVRYTQGYGIRSRGSDTVTDSKRRKASMDIDIIIGDLRISHPPMETVIRAMDTSPYGIFLRTVVNTSQVIKLYPIIQLPDTG